MWEGGQGSRGAVGDPRAGRGHGDIPGQGVQNNPSFLGLPKGIKGVNWCPRQENGGKAPPSSSSSFCNKAQLDPLCCQQPPLWGFGEIWGNRSLPSEKFREMSVCHQGTPEKLLGNAGNSRFAATPVRRTALVAPQGCVATLWFLSPVPSGAALALLGPFGVGQGRKVWGGSGWGGGGVPGSGVVPIPLLQRC